MKTLSLESLIGEPVERLTPPQRNAISGKWVAFEIYSPETLPLKRIEALGDSSADCIRQLVARGLDPSAFEFQIVPPLFHL